MKPIARYLGRTWMVHSAYGSAGGMHFGFGESLEDAYKDWRSNVAPGWYPREKRS